MVKRDSDLKSFFTCISHWRSVLAKDNRSFFYPSADISFIATDAFSILA